MVAAVPSSLLQARIWVAALLAMIAAYGLAWADTRFPVLTGRVVDDAHVISDEAKGRLDTKLADLEGKSGIQLVVATVPSLVGQEIEPYANSLFRSWKLGEAKNDNGVLLLVAPNERRVRIEVGYGLEGTLTDALSKIIITNAMAPRFKTGDFSGGIERGTDDIITVLTTDSAEWAKRPRVREDRSSDDWLSKLLPLLLFGLVVFLLWRSASRGRRGGGGGAPWIVPPMGGGGWGGGSGGFDNGGFSGGGGSSGGGGASGSW